MECPLKAQLQRLFAYQRSEVGGHDVIIMSDVDAFVKDPGIFDNLKENYLVWIYQYQELANGLFIPMCFVAMSKVQWKN